MRLRGAAFAVVLCGASASAQVQLKLDPVNLGEGVGVGFSVGSPLAAEASDLEDLPEAEGALGHFRLRAQVSGIVWQESCACFRYEVLLLPAEGVASAQRFKVKAVPVGAFADQTVAVRFHVTAPGGLELDHGEIRLPVASRRPSPDLTVSLPDECSIPLQGRPTRTLQAANRSKDFAFVLAPGSTGIVAHEPHLWSVGEQALALTGVELQPGDRMPLQLSLSPRLWPALQQSLLAPRPTADAPDGVHARLTLNLAYRNPAFDRTVPVSVVLPLRFKPDLATLALLVTCGVLLGSLARLGLDPARRAAWLGESLVAWAAGLALELVGMLLVTLKSQFVLLNIDLNPFLPLPAAAIGLVAGLSGRQAAELVKNALQWLTRPKPAPSKRGAANGDHE